MNLSPSNGRSALLLFILVELPPARITAVTCAATFSRHLDILINVLVIPHFETQPLLEESRSRPAQFFPLALIEGLRYSGRESRRACLLSSLAKKKGLAIKAPLKRIAL
jgi:hypothetical protein